MKSHRTRAPLPPGFGTIWMAVVVDLVGFGLVFPILPIYAKRFHVSSVTATGLVAAFAAATFVFSPIWGRVSDRIGRKPVLVLSLAGTAVGSLLTGLAGGILILYLGRILDGISGASVSVAQAAVSDVAAPEQRARLFGLLGAAFGIGFVAGPALGALAALGGPRLPFFVAAALAGVNAVVAARRLPETHHPRGRTAAVAGAARAAGAVDLDVEVGGVHAPSSGAVFVPVPVGFGADVQMAVDQEGQIQAPAALGAEVRAPAVVEVDAQAAAGRGGQAGGGVGAQQPAGRNGQMPDPGRPRNPMAALAGGRGVGQLIAVAFSALLAFSAFEATFALFGQRRLGLDIGSSAGVFAAIGLVIVAVQVGAVHALVSRFGETATLRSGLLANAAGLLVLAFVHSWLVLVPALLALTVGQGLVQTTMSSTLAGRADPGRRGEVLGAQQSAGGLARVLGPVLGGVIFQRIGPGAPFMAGAAVTAIALLLLQTTLRANQAAASKP